MSSFSGPHGHPRLPRDADPDKVIVCIATNFWQEHMAWSDDLESLWLECQKEGSDKKFWAAWDNAPYPVQSAVIQGFMPDSNQEIKVWVKKMGDRYEVVGLVQRSKN